MENKRTMQTCYLKKKIKYSHKPGQWLISSLHFPYDSEPSTGLKNSYTTILKLLRPPDTDGWRQ